MPTERKDPSTVFLFHVEIEGLLVAGFTEVQGLQALIDVHTFQEGGVNDYEHHFIERVRYPPLVLKRGFTSSNELWDWFLGYTRGKISRKDGSIIMLNESGDETCRWNFFGSYPVKWIGPELKSTTSEVAVETVEIVHNGLTMVLST
jgi:phage tail-like protein